MIIADAYENLLGSGNVGDQLTGAIANAGSQGTNAQNWGLTSPAGMTVGATSASRVTLDSIQVPGGTVFPKGTSSRSMAYNNQSNFSFIQYFPPGTNSKLALGLWITLGPNFNNFATYDLVSVISQNGHYALIQLTSGIPYAVRIETDFGGVTRSANIGTGSGSTLWCSLLTDFVGGVAQLQTFDTAGALTGNVSCSQLTGDTIASVKVGNNEAGTDTTTTFFENMVLNWTAPSANFPLGPISMAKSLIDSRNPKPNSATTRAVNGTNLCDQQTSSNPAIPATDSRVSVPVASGTYPQNSRTWPLQ